jgi:hypothetical protein
MNDQNIRFAWNAAYWLLRSEARRQTKSRFPDCNWHLVEANDEWVTAVIEAQARVCIEAMQSQPTYFAGSTNTFDAIL